jgi:predicted GNAT family N-acyltransferase
MPTITRTTDIAACRALRRTVFIEEQKVPEADEIDDLDGEAIHLIAHDGGRAVGSARLLIRGATGKIGRVCVLRDMRATGLGAALIRAALAEFAALPAITTVKLGSQLHATGFYERLGFVPTGAIYDDAGIPHRDMVRDLRR